jgi:phosphatidate cytidylyltransferase
MAGSAPERAGAAWPARSDLLRIASALVLAPLAIGAAYWGGWPFVTFWLAAALGIFWEWLGLVGAASARPALLGGGVALALSAALIGLDDFAAAAAVLALGVAAAGLLAPGPQRVWTAGGLVYAATLLLGAALLRRDADWGFVAVMVLFALVWSTDIVAYFAGRTLQGPKLMPLVSPKKTWSGAVAGTIAAVVAAAGVAKAGGVEHVWPLGLLAVLLSVVAQAGDLFESWVKRRFGAKDASHIIPGHGGIMDRLDGFLAAAALAALIGIARGGFAAPARGLLVW